MCGFICIINDNSFHSNDFETLSTQSLKAIAYRGPDSNGIKSLGNFSAAMSQLKTRGEIMDVPVRIDNDLFAYNGEVFGDFKNETPVPKSMVSELKLLFSKEKIDGMFSAVRWSGAKSQAYILRDRFGILPFYYKATNNQLVLGSDLGAFMKTRKQIPNIQALHQTMVLGNTIDNQSVYKGVNKIPPGTNAILTKNRIQLENYHYEIMSNNLGSIEDALRDSVKRCAYTNENMGVTVSGGLDSSIIFQLLCDQGQNLKSYSILNGAEGVINNKSIASESSILPSHYSTNFDSSRLIKDMDALMEIYKEPIALSSTFLIYQLAQLINKDGTRVILSGEGADELFFGYNSYSNFFLNQKNQNQAIHDFYFTEYKMFWYERIMGKDNLDSIKSLFMDDLNNFNYEKPENKFRHTEFKYSLEPLLKRNDLIYMHFGIESRAPFLHANVPDFAMQSNYDNVIKKQQLHDLYFKLSGRKMTRKKRPLRLSLHMEDPNSKFMTRYITKHINELEELGYRAEGILQYFDEHTYDNLYLLVKLYSTLLWKKKHLN